MVFGPRAHQEVNRRSLAVVEALGWKLLPWHSIDPNLVDLDMDGRLHDAPDNDISEEAEPIVTEDACR